MIRTLFLAVFLAALAPSGPVAAFAFHPADETYGYQLPKKWQRNAPEGQSTPPLFGNPKSKFSFDGDGATEPGAKVRNKKAAKVANGGGRPSVGVAKPTVVGFSNSYGAGSIVIDTSKRRLYYVLTSSSAYQYPISVGRQGFTWSGTQTVSKKVAWPDWRPPAEMRQRQPGLPEVMQGGVRNPLGAMALYLGNSLYRIHGTNDVKSIGTAASSGCFRMTNGHVMHLAQVAGVGTKVHVLNKLPAKVAVSG